MRNEQDLIKKAMSLLGKKSGEARKGDTEWGKKMAEAKKNKKEKQLNTPG